MLEIVGFISIFLGAILFLVSAIGLLRMPDTYNRMHIGTKSTTLATLFVLVGAVFIQPDWGFKLLLLAIFIFITNPLSSSVLARAIHKNGFTLKHDEFKDTK
jgi:multicomponent Na+:H+ antiporter subunit G